MKHQLFSWTHKYAALRLTFYLHTLLDFDASIVVVIHHLVYAAQGLQAVAVRLAHAGRGDHHAQVCKDQEQWGGFSPSSSSLEVQVWWFLQQATEKSPERNHYTLNNNENNQRRG